MSLDVEVSSAEGADGAALQRTLLARGTSPPE